MSRIDDMDYLIELAGERGIEIRASRFSDQEIFFTGAFTTSIVGYIFGYRHFYWTPLLLNAVGGFLALKIYGIIPSLKYPLSVFLKDHLKENEKKQLCTKMRMVFKDLSMPSTQEKDETDEIALDEQGWIIENKKQEIVEKMLEFLREKFNVVAVDM